MRSNVRAAPAPVRNGVIDAETRAHWREDLLQDMTRNERIVYDELQKSKSPKKAYALLEALRDKGLRAPMSIYRALDTLIEKGLAKKVASLNAFAAIRPEDNTTVSAFITCRRCGATRQVTLDKEEVRRMLAPAMSSLGEVFIEAYGVCSDDECDHNRR